jgi:hypothetical protein
MNNKCTHFGIEVDDVSNFVENSNEFNSQAHQDLFVLGINQYINNGVWVDIGCGSPREHSNTLLLEQFGWTGVNLDIKNYQNIWEKHRKTEFIHCDATKINYKELFYNTFKSNIINYLSLDIDTASNLVLEQLPFQEFTFNVITIEHDLYAGNSPYRQKGYLKQQLQNDTPEYIKSQQHKILTKHNYVCIAENVCINQKHVLCPFEDWWVSKNIFDQINKKFFNEYSDTILNKLGFILNRDFLTENKNINTLSKTEILKFLASDILEGKKTEINLRQKPRIIFVKEDWLEIFAQKVIPFINYPFAIICNTSKEINIPENQNFKAWFTTKKNKHSKAVFLTECTLMEQFVTVNSTF